MPKLHDNIAYFADRLFARNRSAVFHVGKALIVIAVIAALLEVFVFNFNYFESAGYNTINLKDRIELPQYSNGTFRLTAVDHEVEFSNLNTEIHNIRIDFDSGQPAQNLPIKIQFTDDAHRTYFDSTEYTVGVPVVNVATNSWQSEYIKLKTSGLVNNLKIEVIGDEVSYPIRLITIELNARYPFNFNTLRFTVAFSILLLIYMFRPKSAIYRINMVDNPLRSKAGIVAALIVHVCLISSMLFFGSNLVGVATSSYNYGEWDGVSLINVYETGGENAQQYAELAKAIAEGHLYLNEEPPDWLIEMDDPYDKGARDEAQKSSGEPYLFDVAYYDGHYYVYFGVVPVLLFYLPFYLATGLNFPTAIGVLIMAILFVLGCSALLDRFARYHFKHVSLGLYLLLQLPLVFCSGVLYLIKFPTFYSLPIMCGLAFTVWGLYFWTNARRARHPEFFYIVGSLCMALVAGCRPQLVLLSAVAFPLFWRSFITKRHICTKEGIRQFICLIAPFIVVATGIMWYNYARFGSVMDFGANYNLTVNDMTKRGIVFGRLAPALFSYFLQPPTTTGVFPFLQPAEFATTYMGQTIKEVTFGGILACLPVLWVLFFTKRILAIRKKQRSTRTIFGVIAVLLCAAVVIALFDAELAGILQRYYADFSFEFLAAAVLLVFIVNESMPKTSKTRTMLMNVLLGLVALSLLYSVLLFFVPESGWYSDVYPWAYQDVIETFLFWT